MNKHLKSFLHRGLIFAGLGPITVGIIILIIGLTTKDQSFTTTKFFVSVITSYVLAFVVAGCSTLYNIEKLSTITASFIHCIALYITYLVVYLINSWLDFEWKSILIFTIIFIVGYLIIWAIILLSSKITEKKLNHKIKKH